MSAVRGELSVVIQTKVQYSSDLCTVKRAAGTGLLVQANEGGSNSEGSYL